ncbi:unnamed protein product [Mytilus edulis]|uniref:Uncharacterized protein n=1 Tax=Mytilus edulis TaxID=6550 RepID=A0A8S3RH64_MYTED|nr:unnamed protein product [Mytilus edulis]
MKLTGSERKAVNTSETHSLHTFFSRKSELQQATELQTSVFDARTCVSLVDPLKNIDSDILQTIGQVNENNINFQNISIKQAVVKYPTKPYTIPKRFNQDIVEGWFSHQRGCCGDNREPSHPIWLQQYKATFFKRAKSEVACNSYGKPNIKEVEGKGNIDMSTIDLWTSVHPEDYVVDKLWAHQINSAIIENHKRLIRELALATGGSVRKLPWKKARGCNTTKNNPGHTSTKNISIISSKQHHPSQPPMISPASSVPSPTPVLTEQLPQTNSIGVHFKVGDNVCIASGGNTYDFATVEKISSSERTLPT